jgi:sugar/nucleoside kinase (ribokinase family)
VFLANGAPQVQLKVLDQVPGARLSVADTMDLWINITRDELIEVIRRVDMLTLNESEARLLTGAHNLIDAAGQLLGMGPDHVLIKKGEHGSMLFGTEGTYIQPAFPLAEVIDPTGAGDSFAGALMGYLTEQRACDHHAIRRAMVHGSVIASFGVEAFSLEGLQGLTQEQIQARTDLLLSMMRVD